MKKISNLVLYGLIIISLSSCNNIKGSSSTSSIGTSTDSSNVSSNNTSNSVSSNINEVKTIDFYSINDFHGRISQRRDENSPGISKLSTYLNSKKEENPDGYVLVSTGDT